jgi:hypothetical protein
MVNVKMKHLVIKSHQPSFDYYLELQKGELLTFERKQTDTAGWIWCTTTENRSCWIPEAWVKISGKQCEVLRNYCSRELAVNKGDVIWVEYVEALWVWSRNMDGESGWVPLVCIEEASS